MALNKEQSSATSKEDISQNVNNASVPVGNATTIHNKIPQFMVNSSATRPIYEDIYRPIDSVFDIPDTISSFAGFDRSAFTYFQKSIFIETEDLDVEAHFNEASEQKFDTIQKTIINCIKNFKEIFGLAKNQNKMTLDAYLFNNLEDYTGLGTSYNFTNSFGVTLQENTLGMSFQKPYLLFTTIDDISTLNHEMAHALSYYAVGFKAQCLWNAFNEGVAEYFELLQSPEPLKRDYHIKHAFHVMVDSESKKRRLDEIREALSPSRQFFANQKVNLYSIGFALVSYIQEINPTLIKKFFDKVSSIDDLETACQDSKHFAEELHSHHDEQFKKWLRHKNDILDGKSNLNSDVFEAARDGYITRVIELINQRVDVNKVDKYGRTPLHYAVRNHLDIVKFLIERGADFNAKDVLGNTPLHEAAQNGPLLIVKYLVETGVDLEIKNDNGDTALHEANGRLDIIKYLIENGADFQRASRGDVPLHQATWFNHLDIVKYLVEKGADLEARHESGNTPLQGPAIRGYLDMAKYLVEKGANMSAKGYLGNTPLHEAAKNGNLNIVIYFVEKGADFNIENDNGDTPLHEANGRLEVIKYLIEKGADFQKANRGEVPLYQATWNNHLDIVKYLVEKGADLEVRHESGNTPIQAPTIRGYINIVKYLVEKGANMNVKGYLGNTPLHEAAKNGHLNIVKYLVEKGADFTIKNDNGDTALHAANGRLEIIKYLIEKGADFQTADRGDVPLHQATWNNELEIVKYLVQKGADIEARHESRNTPLQGPAIRGYFDMVKFLVENGANINAKGFMGYTPLHEAAKNGNLDIVNYLVEKGADIRAKGEDGKTPLNLARDNNKLEALVYLEEARRNRTNKLRSKRSIVKSNPSIIRSSKASSLVNLPRRVSNLLKERSLNLVSNIVSESPAKVTGYNESGNIQSVSGRLENVTMPNMLPSIKSLDENIWNECIPDAGRCSGHGKATSNFTAEIAVNTTMVNNTLVLGMLLANFMNKMKHKQPINENLLSPREQSMRLNNTDEYVIISAIQKNEEKFGRLETGVD